MRNLFNKRILSLLVIVAIVFSFAVLAGASAEEASKSEPVKNIIFFIGDGMGMSQVALARYYSLCVLGKELNMTKVMNWGSTAYMTTHPLDFIVTDSAAAGTALASGFKTNNGMISMTPDGVHRITILEKAQELGKNVGILSSTRLTHATPACFAAHIVHRDLENEIAVQMLEHEPNVDVMLAGGWSYFVPQAVKGSKRKDDKDLLAEARDAGYVVVRNAEEFWAVDPKTTDKLLGVFTTSHLSYEIDRDPAKEPSLAEMTQMALEILSKNEEGFFIMIEGGRIDHACHANDTAATIFDTLAMDEAVRVALEYAKKDPNTLIVVTADHETGSPSITKGQPAGEELKYMTAKDLGKIAQIYASFDVLAKEIEEAVDLAEIKDIVKKYTGIEITDEEAQMIKEKAIWLPVAIHDKWLAAVIGEKIKVSWATGHHSAEPVPLFAVGPYCEKFTGFLDNTDVPKIMSEVFGTGY